MNTTETGGIAETVGRSPEDIMRTFERQWAVLVTTFRRDGTPVASAMHIAIDGEHGYFGTSVDAGKVKRIRHNPTGLVAACSPSGKLTGQTFACRLRILEGAEAAHAERAVKRKYPLVQGVLIQLLKTLRRDRGVYVEVTPQPSQAASREARDPPHLRAG